ncbi:hypothetical protein P4H65_07420 [Paenibacillus chitinolyticus]|uniref:hypothetical protein n=1 Tax=Paenibacillus chitinolyticus TaxID=79263 RepID=UPI002DBD4CD0|nr:hypothetical protein [Paenibacillus chitinolyticus]MEC0245621.1 hypothetical protein [Paenibacillus chitinolyticus]
MLQVDTLNPIEKFSWLPDQRDTPKAAGTIMDRQFFCVPVRGPDIDPQRIRHPKIIIDKLSALTRAQWEETQDNLPLMSSHFAPILAAW